MITMQNFNITEEMRLRADENREDLESNDLDTRDYIAVDFCNTFNTDGNFDIWGGDSDPMQMYVGTVCWMTVVVDWNVWRDTAEEFLDQIDRMENWIIKKNRKYKEKLDD